MIQDLLPLLPQTVTHTTLLVCILGLLAGALLLLVGGLWSRAFVTLIAVGVGGAGGMLLPRWYIWPVNSMSVAVLGAVVLGVIAFVLPRIWVAIVLAVVLSAWSVLGTWIFLRGDAVFPMRQEWEVEQMTPPQHARDIFDRLPEPVRRVVPYSVATAALSGMAITLLWPRFSRGLMGSTLGVTLLLLCGLTLVAFYKPDWLGHMPRQWEAQAGVLAGVALLAAILQVQILPNKRERKVLDAMEEQEPKPAVGR